MKKFIVIPVLVKSFLFLTNVSQANVLVDDADSDTEVSDWGFTSADVPKGSGHVGDYQLIVCGVTHQKQTSVFSDPTPGTWTAPGFLFATGSFRCNEVDPIDPIIAVECNVGSGWDAIVTATAPSVNKVVGSQVARIYTYRNFNSRQTTLTLITIHRALILP